MKFKKKWLAFGAGCLVLAGLALGAGFVTTRTIVGPEPVADASGEDTIYMAFGSRPGWDENGMVQSADAVVIGTFTAHLGDKQESLGDSGLIFHYKDYELTVESTLYPDDLDTKLAVLVENGATGPAGQTVGGREDVPDWQDGEKMLLFLESMKDDEQHKEGVGRPVPNGFTKEVYYQVIIGGEYGKLVQDGDDWKDSNSQSTLSVQDINDSIENYKGANRPPVPEPTATPTPEEEPEPCHTTNRSRPKNLSLLRNRSQTTKLTRLRNLNRNLSK